MANTFVLISGTTLTSAAATIAFTSIPATYTDLVIKVSSRSSGSGKARAIRMEFNQDTTYSNYSMLWMGVGSNNLKDQGKFTSATNLPFYLYGISSSAASADAFGITEIYIRSYANGNNKMMQAFSRAESYETAPDGATAFAGYMSGQWAQTAAITHVMIKPDDGNFVAQTTASLYGIKNS